MERKSFEVRTEGSYVGNWFSLSERSRGAISTVFFDAKEIQWFLNQLKKVESLERYMAFNSEGRFIKLTEFVTKRRTIMLIIPEGANLKGWSLLRAEISALVERSNSDVL